MNTVLLNTTCFFIFLPPQVIFLEHSLAAYQNNFAVMCAYDMYVKGTMPEMANYVNIDIITPYDIFM
ncbi:MAG: hypothetical protein AMJ60_10820 [Desulfobacterales bacterium SG8_35]|nr:MAG: hypothetical protein AMJ60_10820 [Desulfobacterales bacterium SG8_35]